MNKQKVRFLSSLLLAVNFVVPTEAMKHGNLKNTTVYGRKKLAKLI